MFLIAPKEERSGDPSLTVEEAKKLKGKYEELFRLKPDLRHGNMLCCIWHTVGETQKALDLINQMIEAADSEPELIAPAARATFYQNRGMFYRAFGEFEKAQKDIFKAWELDKSSAFIGMGAAEEYLRNGDWKRGWKIHNQVRGTAEAAKFSIALPNECKFWDGKETPEHLMVINEGGAGDRINYTRWLPELTRRGIKWSFFCYDELKPLYDRLPWIGPEKTMGESGKKEFSPPPSHWTTVFALPGPLGQLSTTIPDYPTYFTAPENNISMTDPLGRPIVGLCWNANELYQGGLKVRSLTEGQAMRLVCLTADKICWVNVQHGHKMPHPVMNVPFSTWEETAIILDHLDAMVTVDCGTLWLSLGMGKDTAVILTAPEDWKFASEWGPHLKKYRNGPSTSPMDAEKAIDSLILAIRAGEWPTSIPAKRGEVGRIRENEFEAASVPSKGSSTTRLHMASA